MGQKKNFPNTIQLGDINDWENWDLPKIDLVIGGSPCQGFSSMGKRLNFNDHRSKLFFCFSDIINFYKIKNNDLLWLLENVKMKKEYSDIISDYLGVSSVLIDSQLVSAQKRKRLYWTNIGDISLPKNKEIFVNDILEEEVDKKYFCNASWVKWWNTNKDFQLKKGYSTYANLDGKAITQTARQYACWNGNFIYQLPHGVNRGGNKSLDQKVPPMTISQWQYNNLLVTENNIRRLSPIECERLQTFTDNYTDAVNDTQRYKALGNSWTVDVIAHIFSYLPENWKTTQ